MALTAAGFLGVVTLTDGDGDLSELRYELQEDTDADAALTALQAIVTDLNAITDAVVRGYSLNKRYAESALTLPSGVEIQKRAILTANIAGSLPLKTQNFVIPAPSAGIFVGATGPTAKIVDPTDAAVIQYLSNFESGGNAFVSDGEVIMDSSAPGTWSGHKAHRGSRSG